MLPFQIACHVFVSPCLDIISRADYCLQDVFVDEVSVTLRGRDSERLKFSTKVDKISPGQSTLTLSCPVRVTVLTVCSEPTSTSFQTSSWGLYTLESSEIVMSHLRFQWQHKGAATTAKNDRTSLVRVPRNLRALDVQIRQPQQSKQHSFLVCAGFTWWI